MKLIDLFSRLTPKEFAQIQMLLLTEKDLIDPEPFLETICSDEMLKGWRAGRWTLEEALFFHRQGILGSEQPPKVSPSKFAEKMEAVEVPPALFLESDSSSEETLLARLPSQASALNLPIPEELQQPVIAATVKKVSFALESDKSESVSCFSEAQLQRLDRRIRSALKRPCVVKAIEDKVITRENFSSILKLNDRIWATSYIFSEEGIQDLRCHKITLAQLARIPCEDYLKRLLTPHAQKALQAQYISINFIAKIWFGLRHKKIDMELVAILLSEKFLALLHECRFNFMELYNKSYSDICEDLDFERYLDGGYSGETDLILKTFLSVWVEGLTILCSANAKIFFAANSAQDKFFTRLWYFYREKERSVKDIVEDIFQRVSGLQLAFSDEGYWAISQGYLTFSDCDWYESNAIKTYIKQLKTNSALRDVIKQGQLAPEVILNCYAIRFQLGHDSTSDEMSIEKYPGEYFDFFTTPIALQAFKENKICLRTPQERKEAIKLIHRREEYIKKLEIYFEKVRQEYNMHFSLSLTVKKEAEIACFAVGKMCNQLHGMNQKPFTQAEKTALYTPEIVSIFGSIEEWKSVLQATNIRARRSELTNPLDSIYHVPIPSTPPRTLSSPSAMFQLPRESHLGDGSQNSSNDAENRDARFDVFSIALGKGPVP